MTTRDLSPTAPARPARSKSVAAWLGLVGGVFGAHRFYLHGVRDVWGWLLPWPALLGLGGVVRMRNLGQDDHAAWLLIPLLGVMIAVAMLSTIVIALTPDERWAERFGPRDGDGTPRVVPTRWAPVLAAIAALMIGGGVLMGTLAFGGQKFFEYQRERAEAAAPR